MRWSGRRRLITKTFLTFPRTSQKVFFALFREKFRLPAKIILGRVPFDQTFRKFVFKIWNGKFPENRFENFGPPLEVVLFSGNLEFRKIPVPFGISTRYECVPVPLAVKSFKTVASLSSRHYTGCKINCHSSSLFLIAYSPC